MTSNLSIDILKSALIELAQSDRAFFVSLITDLLSENAANPIQKTAKTQKGIKAKSVKNDEPIEKINPPYRKNVEEMREKYAMDKTVLIQLQDLFSDAPTAEEFLQTTNA